MKIVNTTHVNGIKVQTRVRSDEGRYAIEYRVEYDDGTYVGSTIGWEVYAFETDLRKAWKGAWELYESRVWALVGFKHA